MIFVLLFVVLTVLCGMGFYYLTSRIRKYEKIKALGIKGALISVFSVLSFFVIVFVIFGFINTIIIALHLVVAVAFCSFGGFFVSKFTKKERKNFIEDISAILLVVVYLGMGWFFGHHVFETHYVFDTEKNIGNDSFCVVQISDAHLGVTLDGEGFAEQLSRVQNTNPDIVVITGDFVDDDSTREDMITACEALGELKTANGVYFVFGNHDEGYFDSRNFSSEELRENLISNGVVILEDETVLINENIYLIGRKDRSDRDRRDMSELVSELDKSKYMLVLDHQPNDYDSQADAEVDMVLSGHTHGGHIWPAGIIGVLSGSNDRAYGTETRNKTDFVVSSGISGWAIPFKTGTVSEYVVIDIK